MTGVVIKQEIEDDYDEDDSLMVDVSDMVQVEMHEDVVIKSEKNEQNVNKLTESDYSTLFNKRIFPVKQIKPATNGIPRKIVLKNKFISEQHKIKQAKRRRKVELERERRRELTELYDELLFWTEGGASADWSQFR